MKRYSTNYIEWTFCLLIDLIAVGVTYYATRFGLSSPKKYSMDLDGYFIIVVAILVLGLILWDIIVVVDFMIKDVKREIIIDKDKLTIIKSHKEEIFSFKDLIRIEFVGPMIGSRLMSSRWTYCKLIFKNKIIFLTSLTIHNDEIVKNTGQRISTSTNRNRKFFQLNKIIGYITAANVGAYAVLGLGRAKNAAKRNVCATLLVTVSRNQNYIKK